MSRVLPILFNTDMVRAILDRRKTNTRRAVKGFIPDDSIWGYTAFTPKGYISCRGTFADGYGEKFFRLPCRKGDILYVRETWSYDVGGIYIYKASYAENFTGNKDVDSIGNKIKWRPSIHMPKQAARIGLKVTDVRVERLQCMNTGDFLAEGVVIRPEAHNDPENVIGQARAAFVQIWDSMVKKSEINQYGWEADPWVWVIEFERCEKPG